MSWIVSRDFDLGWFFGGSVLSLVALILFFGAGVPIVVLWWVWLLAFDGPHIAAAFTRTYLDPDEWRERRGVLIRGLLVFALGPAAILAGLALDDELPFLLFLGFATLYAWYHRPPALRLLRPLPRARRGPDSARATPGDAQHPQLDRLTPAHVFAAITVGTLCRMVEARLQP